MILLKERFGFPAIDRRLGIGVVLSLFAFTVLFWRATGIYPIVMADEFTHDKFSRLVPLAESPIPNYLYLSIYRLTNACGDQFLGCARFINCVFFVAAGPFIYGVCRVLCGRPVAFFVSLLAIASPMNSVTVYYMAESLYFFLFWVLTWFVLRRAANRGISHWCIAGFLLGLLALVKPHGLFLVAPLATYIAFVTWNSPDGARKHLVRNVAVFVGCFMATKFGLGYVVAGRNGITLFGPTYTSLVRTGDSSIDHYLKVLSAATQNLEGHVLALGLLFGLPIAAMFLLAFRAAPGSSRNDARSQVSVYALLVLGALIPTICLFTASIAGIDPGDTLARIHMRYYDFVSPLLLVIIASQLPSAVPEIGTPITKALPALLVAVVIAIGASGALSSFTPSFVDSPQLLGMVLQKNAFVVLNVLSLVSIGLWLWRGRLGAQVFLFVFMPLSIVLSGYFVNEEIERRAVPDVSDRAGMTARIMLTHEELSRLWIVGRQPSFVYRALFHADVVGPRIEFAVAGHKIDYAPLKEQGNWALVFDDDLPDDDDFTIVPFDGFAFVRSAFTRAVDFKSASWPEVIRRTHGLAPPEPWGTWSSGNRIELEFANALPAHFGVRLTALAYGPNVDRDFVARVGQSTAVFRLGTAAEERVLQFDNPTRSNRLTIDVPAPTVMGVCTGDDLAIGLGLVRLGLVKPNAAVAHVSTRGPTYDEGILLTTMPFN